MMKRGKVYFTFEDIKRLGGLPDDALLKQYIICGDDTVEIEFYSNEVEDHSNIRRNKLLTDITVSEERQIINNYEVVIPNLDLDLDLEMTASEMAEKLASLIKRKRNDHTVITV